MTTDETKRKLIAVVHADVKGYSRMMGEDDEYTVRTLASNRQEMSRLVELHKGQVRDTAGDGFLVEFPSVVDAVKFAVEFQREMKKRNADIPEDKKMEFRIGVNIGDVIQDGGAIYGDGVNMAARLEGLADPGGICMSGAAYEQVKKRLDVKVEYVGVKSVKNIAEPVPTYKVLIEYSETAELKEKSQKAKRGTWRKSSLIAAVIVVVLVASVAIWYFHFHSAPPPDKASLAEAPALKLPDKPSIAVLAFDNMSGDPKQEYFSDGITEEIITGLSKMPDLFVIARNSSFAFKGMAVSVQEVGRKLGVRYVLEGSVRREKDQVRITAQLIDAQTGGHVWSGRYDRDLKDVFVLQDEVTLSIMRAMRVKLTEGEQARYWRERSGEVNREAYEKFLQAMWYARQYTEDGNVAARKLLEEVIAMEPQYAGAYSGLALVHLVDAHTWSKDPGESFRQAYLMAKKALSLDESYDPAHSVLGVIYHSLGKYDEAIAEGERAVELNPNGADALAFLGNILNRAGRPEEAIPALHRAMRLNPMPPAWYYSMLGASYMLTEQYDKAITEFEKGLQLQPDSALHLQWLAATYSMAGREKEACKTVSELIRLNPKFSLERLEKLAMYKDPAVTKRFIDALRKAGLK
ncbi:MAG: adenylate/guanylate cyclase domain-containing protein [Desulfomonilaceae bacterium]